MKWTFHRAKELCGLEDAFEIRTEDDYHFAIRVWKEQVADARRKDLLELAADLSQAKEIFKRRYHNRVVRRCPDCGSAKSVYANRCQPCSITYRFYHHQLYTNSVVMKEHEIESGLVLIPQRQSKGVLTMVCQKMATGQVGDSFVTNKQPTTVKNVCRMMGLQVTIRIANPEEKDVKKRRWRVWRTDGLEWPSVNERIEARLAGKPVPPSPPCVPPPPGTIPDRHKKKETGGPLSGPAEATPTGGPLSGPAESPRRKRT